MARRNTINHATGELDVYDNTGIVVAGYTDEPTGFVDPTSVTVTYDSTTRKITLTGTYTAVWQGVAIIELTDGWESDAHDATDGGWFLSYNGTSFVWSQTPWTFDQLQIAFAYYSTDIKVGIRECHGLMQWQTHEELHTTTGTYRQSGGDLSDYTLSSTTAADRRPDVSACAVHDEDIHTNNAALTSKLYSQHYLSGAGADSNVNLDQADIVPLSGNRPYWNELTGGAWQQTLISNSYYMSIWLIAIPMTADTDSQKYRFIWQQGQSQSINLSTQQELQPSEINYGDLATFSTEYIVIGKVIIRYIGGNWSIIEVESITGSRFNQTGTAGGYLSSVSVDGVNITGDGTASNPLNTSTDLADLFNKTSDGYADITDFQTGVEAYSINNLVEDTTPQLGGNLDGQSYNITTLGDVTCDTLNYTTLNPAVDVSGKLDNTTDTFVGTLTLTGTMNASATVSAEQITSTDDMQASGKILIPVDGSQSDGHLSLGASNDLLIYHDGTNNHVHGLDGTSSNSAGLHLETGNPASRSGSSGYAAGSFEFTTGTGGDVSSAPGQKGGAGGDFVVNTGEGGVITGSSGIGGPAGDFTLTCGDGGLCAASNGLGGAGGSIAMTSGGGTTGPGGGGSAGTFTMTSGAGADANNAGGAGGAFTMTAGGGGSRLTTGSGAPASGNGGPFTLSGGTGGTGLSTVKGGNGGTATFSGGDGGTGGTTGIGGTGGNIVITAGAAGPSGGGGAGSPGEIVLDTGTVKFNDGTNHWTANGTNTVTISNVAPSGVGTATISKWLTVKDNAGTVYYIPAWT